MKVRSWLSRRPIRPPFLPPVQSKWERVRLSLLVGLLAALAVTVALHIVFSWLGQYLGADLLVSVFVAVFISVPGIVVAEIILRSPEPPAQARPRASLVVKNSEDLSRLATGDYLENQLCRR
jgi:hypothetical protein